MLFDEDFTKTIEILYVVHSNSMTKQKNKICQINEQYDDDLQNMLAMFKFQIMFSIYVGTISGYSI